MKTLDEYGVIKIKKKVDMRDILDTMTAISKELGDEFNFVTGTYVDERGYVVDNLRSRPIRVFLGRDINIVICRNTKDDISLLVIRKSGSVKEKVLEKVVSGLVKVTGGKFDGST